MSSISAIPNCSQVTFEELRNEININIDVQIYSPAEVVKKLSDTTGPLDLYTWYEGPFNLPASGARFLKESIFAPLYKIKKDVKLWLYSLNAWNFKKRVSQMPKTTSIGNAVNRIDKRIECIYASSFFRFCKEESLSNELRNLLSEELPKKEQLIRLSEKYTKRNLAVATLFENQSSLFDSIQEKDVSEAYALMQYVEGYYLVQNSVKKGLAEGKKRIEIAFVLPNNESVYYTDFKKDIPKLLCADFKQKIDKLEININFYFYKYKEESDRPYIEKGKNAPLVKAEEIPSYFDYLRQVERPFLRDVIHKLNG